MGWKDHYYEQIPADLPRLLKAPGDFIITKVSGSVHRIHYVANQPLRCHGSILKTVDFDLNDWKGCVDALCTLVQSGLKKIIALDFELKGTVEENRVIEALQASHHCDLVFPEEDEHSVVEDRIANQYDLLLLRNELLPNGFINFHRPDFIIDVVDCFALTESVRGSIRTCENAGIRVFEVDKYSNQHLLLLDRALGLGVVPKKVFYPRPKAPNPLMQTGFGVNKRLQFLPDVSDINVTPNSDLSDSSNKRTKISKLVL